MDCESQKLNLAQQFPIEGIPSYSYSPDSPSYLPSKSTPNSSSPSSDEEINASTTPNSQRSSRSNSSVFSRTSSRSSSSSVSSINPGSPTKLKMDYGVAQALGYPTPPPQRHQYNARREALACPVFHGDGGEDLGIKQREIRVGEKRLVEVDNGRQGEDGPLHASSSSHVGQRKECPLPQANRLNGAAKQFFVDGLIGTSVKAIESIWKIDAAAPGSNPSEKVLPLNWFIKEVLRRSRTSASVLQTGLYYLHRSRRAIRCRIIKAEEAHARLESLYNSMEVDEPGPPESEVEQLIAIQHDPVLCGRRMFLASLIAASKFLQDRNYSNQAWAKISGLDVKEININERSFLALMDYKLHVDADVFCKWSDQLMRLCQGQPPVPVPPTNLLRRTQSQATDHFATTEIRAPSRPGSTRPIDVPQPLHKSLSQLPRPNPNGYSVIVPNVREPTYQSQYSESPEEESSEEEEEDVEVEESMPIKSSSEDRSRNEYRARLASGYPDGQTRFGNGSCAAQESERRRNVSYGGNGGVRFMNISAH